MKNKVSIILGMCAITLFVGVGRNWHFEVGKDLNQEENDEEIVESLKEEPQAIEENIVIPENEVIKEIIQEAVKEENVEIKNAVCKTLDCFMELANDCKKGEVTHYYSVPFLLGDGVNMTGINRYVLHGRDKNKQCTFTQQSQGSEAKISIEGREKALAEGFTNEEVDAQIEAINGALNDPALLESIMTCRGAEKDIITYLQNTQQGIGKTSCSFDFGKDETVCIVEPNLSCITKITTK